MAEGTKARILEAALALFAQNGYLGTSMSDIAGQLGITKAALYKHYASKQDILDRIVERMNEMDDERAKAYEMPETAPDGFAEAYLHTPVEKIRTYSAAQFDHWTKEPFAANFRKMLTLEQYRDPALARLYQNYLAAGPLAYMAAIFRKLTDSDQAAMELALAFYGPMYLLYSIRRRGGQGQRLSPAGCPHRPVHRHGGGRTLEGRDSAVSASSTRRISSSRPRKPDAKTQCRS